MQDKVFFNSTRPACKTCDTWGFGHASGQGTPTSDGYGSSIIIEQHRFRGHGCGNCRSGRGARVPGRGAPVPGRGKRGMYMVTDTTLTTGYGRGACSDPGDGTRGWGA